MDRHQKVERWKGNMPTRSIRARLKWLRLHKCIRVTTTPSFLEPIDAVLEFHKVSWWHSNMNEQEAVVHDGREHNHRDGRDEYGREHNHQAAQESAMVPTTVAGEPCKQHRGSETRGRLKLPVSTLAKKT